MNSHNGPGFRTVIYFKGCPLHCTWCHNPEGIHFQKEVWFNPIKCIACGICVDNCPEKALELSNRGIIIDREICKGCQVCSEVCPSRAMKKIGESYSVNDLMKIIRQDINLFDESGGGITATGGEPGSQADFVAELFRQCRNENIHTAFDTSGIITISNLNKILPFVNMVFLDIKILDNDKSLLYTGLPLKNLYNTIRRLNVFQNENPNLRIEIRTPLIPEVNDDADSLMAIGELVYKSFSKIPGWELCMFNDLCEDKYIRMGMQWKFKNKYRSDEYIKLKKLQEKLPVSSVITGFPVYRENTL
jgi:pyruvate formate lyase activating enzyme